MNRRDFLRGMAVGLGAHPLFAQFSEDPEWRSYELTTTVKVLRPSGQTRVWLLLPLAEDTAFQRTLSSSLQCDGGKTFLHEERHTGLKMLGATFPPGTAAVITTTHWVATRDWSIDLEQSSAGNNHPIPADAASFLKPTEYVPTDGIVKERANEITRGAHTDLEKTRAIYDWIVINTYRNPKVRGCGVGDIRPMLETGDLGGKCAGLNGLFVGLVKASGVPARDVYGIRARHSALQCSSLGTSSGAVSKAQHCRAEVYLADFGWVPMDPADVRKVVLEEPPGRSQAALLHVPASRDGRRKAGLSGCRELPLRDYFA